MPAILVYLEPVEGGNHLAGFLPPRFGPRTLRRRRCSRAATQLLGGSCSRWAIRPSAGRRPYRSELVLAALATTGLYLFWNLGRSGLEPAERPSLSMRARSLCRYSHGSRSGSGSPKPGAGRCLAASLGGPAGGSATARGDHHRQRLTGVLEQLAGRRRPKRRLARMDQRPGPQAVHRYPGRARVAQLAGASITRPSRRELLRPCLAHHRRLPLVGCHTQSCREPAPAASGLPPGRHRVFSACGRPFLGLRLAA